MKKEDKVVKLWRRKFREYVKAHNWLDLHDRDGNDIAFDGKNPMWAENSVVDECGGDIVVEVGMDGLVRSDDEDPIKEWLRKFAASMGRFSVEVDVTKKNDKGADYSVLAYMEIPKELSKRANASRRFSGKDSMEFWIIGDPSIRQFMALDFREYLADSDGTTNNTLSADRYDTFVEAVNDMCVREDVILWAGSRPFPSRVRPLKVNVEVSLR